MGRLTTLLIALWTGSLLTACAVVAPLAFKVIGEKSIAGKFTGSVFATQGWIGLVVLAVALVGWTRGSELPTGVFIYALLGITTIAPWIGAIALHPLMEKARVASDMKLFGMVHGISGLLFAAACLAGLVLSWLLNRRVA
jgi:hypothetical protein